MKKLILIAPLAAFFLLSCGDDGKRTGHNTVVTGKLENSNGETVYLVNVSQRDFIYVDSFVTGPDGTFEFQPTLEYKDFYYIEVARSAEQFATIILEPKDSVTFSADAKNMGYTWKTSGSKDSDDFLKFNEYFTQYDQRRRPYMNRLDSLQRTFQIQLSMMKDSVARETLEKEVIEPT